MNIVYKLFDIIEAYLILFCKKISFLFKNFKNINYSELYNLLTLKKGEYSLEIYTFATFIINTVLFFINPIFLFLYPFIGDKKYTIYAIILYAITLFISTLIFNTISVALLAISFIFIVYYLITLRNIIEGIDDDDEIF